MEEGSHVRTPLQMGQILHDSASTIQDLSNGTLFASIGQELAKLLFLR